MDHIDYSSGMIAWEDAPTSKAPYLCTDPEGRKVEVTVKYEARHESFHPLQNDPAYHYNVGYIIGNPDRIITKPSRNSTSKKHIDEAEVLTYVKDNFIMSLDMPASYQVKHDETHVTVKYTDKRNHTLTSIVYKKTDDI